MTTLAAKWVRKTNRSIKHASRPNPAAATGRARANAAETTRWGLAHAPTDRLRHSNAEILLFPDGSAAAVDTDHSPRPRLFTLSKTELAALPHRPHLPPPPDRAPQQLPPGYSQNTLRTYANAWQAFTRWTTSRSLIPFPADADTITWYIQHLSSQGRSPHTVRFHASAIEAHHAAASVHRTPQHAKAVSGALKAITRDDPRVQKQATPINYPEMTAIARLLIPSRRSSASEIRRNLRDVTLIQVMRDGLLRCAEASELLWADVHPRPNGTATLTIRRSKTDPFALGATAFLSEEPTANLMRLKAMAKPSDRVFPITPRRIAARIKDTARRAGLHGNYSGHSPRVGMAQDLAAEGIQLPALMTAGRWTTSVMPARYTKNTEAARGAVAQYYQNRR